MPKNNLLSAKNSLLALSLSVAASAYGDACCEIPCQQPCLEPSCPPWCEAPVEAINYPVRMDIRCPENIYAEVSFNYWQPIQENMEVGVLNNGASENISTTGLTINAVSSSDSYRDINMNFHYKPGFTLGMGYYFGQDNWDMRAQYTWFHNSHRKSEFASNFLLFETGTQGIVPTWGSLTPSEESVVFQFASEKWKLGMDIADLDLGRWCYVGRRLTFHPTLGVRAAFIHQKVHVTYNNGFTNYTVDLPGLLGSGTLVENKNISGKSQSWGLGPKLALEMDWLMGCGFRLFGMGEADVLYTRYFSLREKTLTTGSVMGIINLIPFNFALNDDTSGKQRKVGCLRTHLDLELGFGWGTHLSSNGLYLDCSAAYDFQVFFDQNMLRRNVTDAGGSLPEGNLYLQGLIAKVRLDF